jgi:hypothetical protein
MTAVTATVTAGPAVTATLTDGTQVDVLINPLASDLGPTGTGFRHVVAGVEDAAAKLVENADVASNAAIAWSKISTAGQVVDASVGAAAAIAWSKISKSGAVAADVGAVDAAAVTTAVGNHAALTSGTHGISTFAATVLDDATAADARATLGLVIGTNVQAQDAELAAIAGLTSAADTFPYFTGSGTAALGTVTAAGRALLDDASSTDQRATLGLVIGTNVQAQDAELAALAGLTSAADTFPYFTGSGTAALGTVTAAGRALLDDANVAAQLTTLGIPLLATTGITGVLTLSKTGTTARTATFPDAAITVAGSASALTSGRVPYVTTGGLLTDGAGLTYSAYLLTVGDGTSTAYAYLNGAAGSTRQIRYLTNGTRRWTAEADGAAEGGSDAGSKYVITAYTDAGAAVDSPLSITRAAGGAITLARPVTCTGAVTVPNGTAAAPGIRLTGEAHGLYRNASTSIGIACAGAYAADFTGASAGNWAAFLRISTATDPGLIIGTSSNSLMVYGSDTGSSQGGQVRVYGSSHGSRASYVEFTRGATVSAYFNASGALICNGTVATSGAITTTAAAGIISKQSAAQDAIALVGRAGGSGTYQISLTPSTLAASRTATFPDASGTVALLSLAQTWSAQQSFAATTGTIRLVGDGDGSTGSVDSIYGDLLKHKKFGYSSSYTTAMLGSAARSISLGVDTSAIAGSRFNGDNRDIVVRRGGILLCADSGGTNFVAALRVNGGAASLSLPIVDIDDAAITLRAATALTSTLTTAGGITTTAAAGITTRQAATQDGVILVGRAGGSGTYSVSITPTTLTANRTLTLPDASIIAAGSSSALTSGRVPYATTGGLLIDSAEFTATPASVVVLSLGSNARASAAYLSINAAAANVRGLAFQTAGSNRWIAQAYSTAESGSDAGSPFYITAFSDAGATIDSPIIITRAAGGAITAARPLTVSYSSAILTVGNGAGSPQLVINGAAANARLAKWQTAGSLRWEVGADATAESGTNAGSLFVVKAYTDAGAAIDTPISLPRVAGAALTVARPIACTDTTAATTTTAASATFAGGVGIAKELVMPAADWVYFGPVATDGSWRMGRSGNDFVHQRRESAAWVTKLQVVA